MAEPIGALRAELSASAAAFAKDMKVARRAVKSETTRMQRSFHKLSMQTQKVSANIFNLRNAAVGAAGVSGLALLVRRSIATADEIGKTAKAVSLSAEALQEYRFAARRAGVDSGQLDKALVFLSKSVSELKTRTSNELTTALKDFNPKLLETLRNVESNEQAFHLIGDAISNASNEFERAAIARAAFGRGGLQMIEMLRGGSAGMKDMAARARELGIVIDNEMIRRAEKANDELDDMADVFKVAGTNLALNLMPFLKELAEVVTSQSFQDGIKDFGEGLKGALEWIVDNQETIVRVLGVIAGLKLGARFGPKGAAAGALGGALFSGGVLPMGNEDGSASIDIQKLRDAIGIEFGPPKNNGSGGSLIPDQSAKVIENLQRELSLVGATNEQRRLSNLLKQAGVDLDSEQGREIEMLVGHIARETEELRNLEMVAQTVGDSMGATFSEFIQTGKLDFKDMVDSMLKDLARLAVQMAVIQPFVKGLTGFLGGGPFGLIGDLFSGFFAQGGTIPKGTFGIVGERGPEPVFAKQDLSVLPNSALRGGGGMVQVAIRIDESDGGLRAFVEHTSGRVSAGVVRGATDGIVAKSVRANAASVASGDQDAAQAHRYGNSPKAFDR